MIFFRILWFVACRYIIIRLVKIFRPVIYFGIILSDYFRIKARRRRKFLRFLPIYFANLICKNPSIDQGEVFDRGRGVCLFVCGAPAPPSGLYGLRPHTSWRLMGPLWLQEKITKSGYEEAEGCFFDRGRGRGMNFEDDRGRGVAEGCFFGRGRGLGRSLTQWIYSETPNSGPRNFGAIKIGPAKFSHFAESYIQ